MCSHVELVKVITSDGLELDGILAMPERPRAVVIHVHGKCGNFYQNPFIAVMLASYVARGIAVYSFNNRGHDCLAEAYRSGQLVYVGGSLESGDVSHLDVAAAVSYISARFDLPIYLQGHSSGCDKVVGAWYGQIADCDGLILLSPADSWRLYELWLARQQSLLGHPGATSGTALTEEDVLTASATTDPRQLVLSLAEYGVPGPNGYTIPVTLGALDRMVENDSLKCFTDPLVLPPCPLFIYVGGADTLQTRSIDDWRRATRPDRHRLLHLPTGDHRFAGFEEEVVATISGWILEQVAFAASQANEGIT